MITRCRDCGQFVKVANPAAKHDHTCGRCYSVEHYYEIGNIRVGCEAGVEDRDGDLEPCCKPVYGIRWDVEFDAYYAVCRRHYVPPFDRCHFDDDERTCVTHSGRRYDDADYCDRAHDDPQSSPAVPSPDFPTAGEPNERKA